MSSFCQIEQDWLFEKLLGKLNAHRHLMLSAEHGWGIKEYVHELGFQLSERNRDIHVCYMDLRPVHSTDSFTDHFVAALTQRFPEVTSQLNPARFNTDMLKLPAFIAKRNKIRVAVFVTNAHLLHRFSNQLQFLRLLKLKLMHQKKCMFCLSGKHTTHFQDLLDYPGPLSGLGQHFKLKHDPSKHRSASIRKLFHDHGKNIGYDTSVYMSFMVDNHPVYLKLLAWHALIRTRTHCTKSNVEEALDDLIHHFSHHFTKLSERLTPKQLGFLRALADGNQQFYSKATRDAYELGTTGTTSRIKQSLLGKEIIFDGEWECGFTDPIFKAWILRNSHESRQRPDPGSADFNKL